MEQRVQRMQDIVQTGWKGMWDMVMYELQTEDDMYMHLHFYDVPSRQAVWTRVDGKLVLLHVEWSK